MFAVRFTHLGLGVLLPILLVTAPHLQGQTANPQLLPYATTLVAGGGATATFTVGAICPSGKKASDKFGDGCLATEVQLNVPRYVTEDSQGNVFISDSKNAIIRRVDAVSGVITAIAGGVTANPAKSAACGGSDTNTSNDWQGDGCLSTSVKLGAPQGLAFSPLTGNLYFGDTSNSTVRMIAADSSGLITGPGVISNVAGNIAGTKATFGYAANTASSTINAATGGSLDSPYGVTFDKQGVLYIADEFRNAILAVNITSPTVTIADISIPTGTIAKIAGFQNAGDGAYCPNGTTSSAGCASGAWTSGNPASTSQMHSPYALVTDGQGDVYFANEFSAAVAQISSAGIISTWAGTQASTTVTNQRGKANTVPIGSNFGLAIDTNGNIYTSDSLKGWIWRVDAANQGIYVFAGAGTPCAGAYGDGCPANQTKFSTGTIEGGGTFATVGVAGLYSDAAGTLFIADSVAGLIHKIATNANFGTILATNPTQTINIHFGVNDSPGGTPYTLTANPNNFSLGAPSCTTNTDNTTDCLLPITATPTQTASGPFSSTLHIASTRGLNADITLTGYLELEQVASNTSLNLSTNSTNPVSPVTITATVSSTTTSVPITGTVTFYNNGTQIGTPQAAANGQASIQYTFPVGTASVTASYSGSQFFFGSTSAANSVTSVIPTFTVTPVQSMVTVAQGQIAANGITLISAGSYAGTVTFACSGLPANASCQFNPSSVTVGAGGATVALSIITAGPGISAARPLALPSSRGGQIVFACLPGAALLLLVVRARSNGKLPTTLLLLAILISGSAFLNGCSSGAKAGPATATGTSTLTITATGTPNVVSTGTNIVQTVSMTLAVTPQP